MNLNFLSEIFTTDLAESEMLYHKVGPLCESLGIEPLSINGIFQPCKIKRTSTNLIEKSINFRTCFYRYLFVDAVKSSDKEKKGIEKLYNVLFIPALTVDSVSILSLQVLKLVFIHFYVSAILVNSLSKIIFQRKKITTVIFEAFDSTFYLPIYLMLSNTLKICELIARVFLLNNVPKFPEDANFLDGKMFPWCKFKDCRFNEERTYFDEEKYRLIWAKALDRNSEILKKFPQSETIWFIKNRRVVCIVDPWNQNVAKIIITYKPKTNSPF